MLIGLDTSINYTKLSRAFRYLHSNPECFFLATNEDSTYPSEKGLLPGAGAILAPLVTALGPNRPVTAIGKPSSLMLDAIKAKCVHPNPGHLCVTSMPLSACSIRQNFFADHCFNFPFGVLICSIAGIILTPNARSWLVTG